MDSFTDGGGGGGGNPLAVWEDCLYRTQAGVQTNVVTLDCVPYLFSNVINAALALAGTVAVFVIIFSGVRFLLSQGDPKKVDEAKTTLTYAIVGLVIVLLSGFIMNVLTSALGIPCAQVFGFDTCK